MTKSDQIRELAKQGVTKDAIAARLSVNVHYVRVVLNQRSDSRFNRKVALGTLTYEANFIAKHGRRPFGGSAYCRRKRAEREAHA